MTPPSPRIVGDLSRTRPGRSWDAAEVVKASLAGDLMVHRLLYDAGTSLGLAVAPMCNLLSPDVVVLGGPLAHGGQPLLDGMVASVRQRALPTATAGTTFALTQLDDDAEVQGACLLALHVGRRAPSSGCRRRSAPRPRNRRAPRPPPDACAPGTPWCGGGAGR